MTPESSSETAEPTPDKPGEPTGQTSGHAGELPVQVARAHGVETLFTLSGAHVFPMYDGAVTAEPPMRILDVRHEQTAAFAAGGAGEADARAGAGGADGRTGRHERHQRHRAGAVRGVTDGGRRWPRPAEPMGQ